MKLEKYHAWIVVMFFIAMSMPVFADVYKCKQAGGRLAYSDSPCPNGYGTKINLTPNDFGGISLPAASLTELTQRDLSPNSKKQRVMPAPELQVKADSTHMTDLGDGSDIPPKGLLPFSSPIGTNLINQSQDNDASAWKNCIPKSIGPGGCDSIGPGGGQSIGPGGGQSIGPGGGQSMTRDRRFGFNPDTMRPYTCAEGGMC